MAAIFSLVYRDLMPSMMASICFRFIFDLYGSLEAEGCGCQVLALSSFEALFVAPLKDSPTSPFLTCGFCFLTGMV